ncbi:MAG TPA: hypothetical protein VE338_17365 [Ktedonobacterales bacterium]|nr:hypothetical protein [Ktedonobacterales bacterium]
MSIMNAKNAEDTKNATDPTYAFWQYIPTGAIYAVRLQTHGLADDLTGICGPLQPGEIQPANLARFDYDDQRDDVAWAEQHEPSDWRMYSV